MMDKAVKMRWETKIKELEEEMKTCQYPERYAELADRIGKIKAKIEEVKE